MTNHNDAIDRALERLAECHGTLMRREHRTILTDLVDEATVHWNKANDSLNKKRVRAEMRLAAVVESAENLMALWDMGDLTHYDLGEHRALARGEGGEQGDVRLATEGASPNPSDYAAPAAPDAQIKSGNDIMWEHKATLLHDAADLAPLGDFELVSEEVFNAAWTDADGLQVSSEQEHRARLNFLLSKRYRAEDLPYPTINEYPPKGPVDDTFDGVEPGMADTYGGPDRARSELKNIRAMSALADALVDRLSEQVVDLQQTIQRIRDAAKNEGLTPHQRWEAINQILAEPWWEPSQPSPGLHQRLALMREIRKERERQIRKEGFTEEHDNRHRRGDLARAAACYAKEAFTIGAGQRDPLDWPWTLISYKRKDPRSNLIRAAALIVAEIERLDRMGGGQ